MVYTEGTLSDMFQAVKKFVLKIWDKIKAFFKRFIMLFDVYYKEDKAFVDKYRKQIFEAKNLSDFEFKGYKFDLNIGPHAEKLIQGCRIFSKFHKSVAKLSDTIMKNDAASEDDAKELNKSYDKDYDNYDDEMDKARGEILKIAFSGVSGSYTDSEFKKELHDKFRGDGEKEDLDNEYKDPGNAVARLVGSKNAKKDLKTMFNSSKKMIDSAIKEIETIQKESIKDSGKDANKKERNAASVKSAGYALRAMRDSRSLMASINGIALQAMKDFSRQDKSMLVAIMRYSPKKEGFSESGNMNWEHEDETARNFLGSINLV
jgi:hypothetical protein